MDEHHLVVKYKNGKVAQVQAALVQLLVTFDKGVMVFFTQPQCVIGSGSKAKRGVVAHLRQNHKLPGDNVSACRKTCAVLDITDVPQVALADGSRAFMHDDAVVWLDRNGAGHAASFESTTAAVFQRLHGGASTFDINFIGPHGLQTLEYVPYSVLSNVVEYLPKHVMIMTNGADPIRLQHVTAAIEGKTDEAIKEMVSQWWTPLQDAHESDASESDDDGSEYNPDTCSEDSSDYDDDMDSEDDELSDDME